MNLPICPNGSRRKAIWGPRRTAAALLLALLGVAPVAMATPASAKPGTPGPTVKQYKLDDELQKRAGLATGKTRVIVELQPGAKLPPQFKQLFKRHLGIINSDVLDVPNGVLKQLAAHPSVFRLHYDRPTMAHNYRTTVSSGARAARSWFGLTGAGVGVAIIDSGITTWHDDLSGAADPSVFPYGNQRVMQFVDFVNGQTTPYDDNGHGTHVAGIIAGNGFDSYGKMAGMAPRARLVSLKVLDANGLGTISNIIAAFDWVVANHAQYNVRVVNLSVGAPINESYWTDPLTLAAKAVVDSGVVVVAAAGNFGKNSSGYIQYGGITAPGNAPWVLTVGASSSMGTLTRADDTVAGFSSRGPANIDFAAKPDIVAGGAGIESLASPGSTLVTENPGWVVSGITGGDYLVLSGTSMASPAVTGTVALMMQANPNLTPNEVKAILEYTAQAYPGYDPLTQGAGFLNTLGATRLALFFRTAQPGQTIPVQDIWSKRLIWGNQMITGGVITPDANAWGTNVVWGAATTSDTGDNIVWGSACADATCDNIVWGSDSLDNIVWGSSCADDACDNIVWGSTTGEFNVVWGANCGGGDCASVVWGADSLDNIVWGSTATDNIVWGSSVDSDNIVWGSSSLDNIVWGSSDSDNIVWGSSDSDNIVWGSSDSDNIVWGSDTGDNIVWGMDSGDNIVWGSSVSGGFLWGGSDTVLAVWNWLIGTVVPPDAVLFGLEPPPTITTTTSTTTTTTTTTTTSTGGVL